MTNDELERIKARAMARLEKPFEPLIGTGSISPKAEDRAAHALEYIAHQLGKIRESLSPKG